MDLSKADRYRLKKGIVDAVESDPAWTTTRLGLLLTEYDLEPLTDEELSSVFMRCYVSDEQLFEMYRLVLDAEPASALQTADAATESGSWKPDCFRLFASHSALHKEFVSEVADELLAVGVHAFVAHDTMEVSRPWQEQIEQHLRSMQALVAFVHPEFNESAWCHEEIGWAYGRKVPVFAVRIGADPVAFIGRQQWPSCILGTAAKVAGVIGQWLTTLPIYGDDLFERLIVGLEKARSYPDAGAAAKRIAALGGLTDSQWERLRQVYWSNSQAYSSVLVEKVLKPLYLENERDYPPPKPES